MKITNFLKFFRKEKHPSYLQEEKFISYANTLLDKEDYASLYEMTKKGYQLTPKQSSIITCEVSRMMFHTKMNVFHKSDSKNLNAALLLYKKEPNPQNFYNGFAPYDSHDSLFLYMRFDVKFFYCHGQNSLEKIPGINSTENIINYRIRDDHTIIKNGIDVISSVISSFLDSNHKKKNEKVERIISLIPIEFHYFLLEKDERLKNFLDGKTNRSNYDVAQELTFDREYNKGKKFAQLDMIDQKNLNEKEDFYNTAKKYLPTISTNIQNSNNLHQSMLTSLDSKSKENINEYNFITSDISKVYDLPEDVQKKVTLIQALYGKLIVERNTSTENEYFITNTPKNTLNILKNYDVSKEILKDESLKFLDSLDVLVESLLKMNLQIEQDKVKNLSVDNQVQKRMSR